MYHFVQPITYTHVHAHMHFTCNELKAFTNGACSSMQQYIYIHIYIYWGGGGGGEGENFIRIHPTIGYMDNSLRKL